MWYNCAYEFTHCSPCQLHMKHNPLHWRMGCRLSDKMSSALKMGWNWVWAILHDKYIVIQCTLSLKFLYSQFTCTVVKNPVSKVCSDNIILNWYNTKKTTTICILIPQQKEKMSDTQNMIHCFELTTSTQYSSVYQVLILLTTLQWI